MCACLCWSVLVSREVGESSRFNEWEAVAKRLTDGERELGWGVLKVSPGCLGFAGGQDGAQF